MVLGSQSFSSILNLMLSFHLPCKTTLSSSDNSRMLACARNDVLFGPARTSKTGPMKVLNIAFIDVRLDFMDIDCYADVDGDRNVGSLRSGGDGLVL